MIRMDWLKVLEHRVAQRTDRANTVLYILAVAPLMGAMWLLQWAPALQGVWVSVPSGSATA